MRVVIRDTDGNITNILEMDTLIVPDEFDAEKLRQDIKASIRMIDESEEKLTQMRIETNNCDNFIILKCIQYMDTTNEDIDNNECEVIVGYSDKEKFDTALRRVTMHGYLDTIDGSLVEFTPGFKYSKFFEPDTELMFMNLD